MRPARVFIVVAVGIPTLPPGEGGVAMMPQLVRLNLAAGVAVVKASAAVWVRLPKGARNRCVFW